MPLENIRNLIIKLQNDKEQQIKMIEDTFNKKI